MQVVFYNDNHYNKDRFHNIKNTNCKFRKKPNGGLWTSPIDSNFGWKQWCEQEEFYLGKTKSILTLDNPKLLILDSILDFNKNIIFDFEYLATKYDGIHLTERGLRDLYWDLYRWECECILIFNSNIIVSYYIEN